MNIKFDNLGYGAVFQASRSIFKLIGAIRRKDLSDITVAAFDLAAVFTNVEEEIPREQVKAMAQGIEDLAMEMVGAPSTA